MQTDFKLRALLTTADILSELDNCHKNAYCHFITLSHPYVYLIDSRLNVFRGDEERWAIASEVLGYNPRGGDIRLEITYFGNCLVNLEEYQNLSVNSYWPSPGAVNFEEFVDTLDVNVLKPDAGFWIVRDQQVPLSHNNQDYIDAGIELKEYEPGEISAEEAARLAIIGRQELFRATDDELYKSVPKDLEKILVLDEWYHKEFFQDNHFENINKLMTLLDSYGESVKNIARKQEEEKTLRNIEEWNNNRPGSYETWQQIAEVIVLGDVSKYQPTLTPNNHWKNWPESGTL